MGVRGENNRFLQPEAITDSWQGSRTGPVSGCSPRNGQRFPRKGTRVWKTPRKGGETSLEPPNLGPQYRVLGRGCRGLGSSYGQCLQTQEPRFSVTEPSRHWCAEPLAGRHIPARHSWASLIPEGLTQPSSLDSHLPCYAESFPLRLRQ